MSTAPQPRTLFRVPSREGPKYLLCFPDGTCWILCPGPCWPSNRGPEGPIGWDWAWGSTWVTKGEKILECLSDPEISALEDHEGRETLIAHLLNQRSSHDSP